MENDDRRSALQHAADTARARLEEVVVASPPVNVMITDTRDGKDHAG